MPPSPQPPANVCCMQCGWDVCCNTWLQLAHEVALNGRVSVLCGSLLPSQLEPLPARGLIGPIRFCTLDCPDAVLADRLRRRPSWRGSSAETVIAEHQRFAAWLRAHIDPCYDTSQLTPDQAADRIAAWVSQRPVALLTFRIYLPNCEVRRY